MSVYTATYGPVYPGPFGLPQVPLDAAVELSLAGTWTDITSYALQRDGSSPPIQITRGRPDERSTASPSTCSMQWNNRSGRFSPRNPSGPYYGTLNRNTPVRVSVPAAGTAMRIEDDTTASATASAFTAVTGDIDIRLEMWLSSYMPCSLARSATNWSLVLNGDGTIGLLIASATLYSSTLPIPVGHGAVRVTRVESTGVITFYTSGTIGGAWTQLGATVTSTSGTLGSGSGLLAGYDNVANTVLGYEGPSGLFYAFQVYSGIGGTVEANPDFTAQAAGTINFTDSAGTAWNMGDATIDGRSYRCHTEASALPQQWDTSGTDVWTPVQGAGVLRRLAQGSSPTLSAMKRGILNQAGPSGVKAYWPAEDGTGATQIASGLPGGTGMSLNGTPTFSNQLGSPSSDQIFECSAGLPQIQSSAWTGYVPSYTSIGQDAVTFLLDIPSALSGATHLLTVAFHSGDDLTLHYTTDAGGSLFIFQDGVNIATGPAGVNGQALLCQLSNIVSSTSGLLWTLPLGIGETESFWTGTTAATGRVVSVTVNPGLAACGSTEIGHIAVTSTSPGPQATFGFPFNAWDGETAGYRFARLCGENTVAARVYGFPGATQAMGPQAVDTLLNLLTECETADRGIIYEPATILGLGYRTFGSLCNQAASVTLDYSAATLGGDGSQGLVPVDDDQYTLNDITVTIGNNAATGSSYEAVLDDGSPMSVSPPADGGVGVYDTTVTVNVQTAAQLPDVAGWMLHTGTTNEERYPVIPLNEARYELGNWFYAIQDTAVGDRVVISNPPAWLPPGDITQLIYGTTEQLAGYWWLIAWNAVPESPYETAVSDDVVLGRADTDGSTLHTSVSSTATSLSVSTTAAGSPLWTTGDSGGAGPQLLIPMYAYPSGSGATFWADVTAAAPTTGILIGNPGSGPGGSTDPDYAAVFAAAQAAGITVVGYVYTDYGARAVADVQADIAGWASLYKITDIFLDEVSSSATELTYYEGLIDYIRGLARTATIVLNPGVVPAQGYFDLGADVICVCEDAYANLATDAGAAPGWLFGYPATMISVVVNQCSTSGNMATALGLAQSAFNAGYVWVTSDSLYGVEPSYFATEVTDVAALVGTGDFPFDVAVGGEQITVTGISGSSSPQTFTVLRSVNGVIKAHTAGEDVRLFSPPILALT